MPEIKKTEGTVASGGGELENLCCDLFDEWFFGLGSKEKEIWLWNSIVEMEKIKQRRSSRKQGLAF